jgi:hypothetical protein
MIDIQFNKYEPLKRTKSEDFLKKLAIDLENELVFTDRHISNIDNISTVFMPLICMFGSGKKTDDDRKSKIYNILLDYEKEKYFKSLNKTEDECAIEYFDSIGLIYEYLDKRTPMSVNKKPSFMSCFILSKEDTLVLFKFYEEYKILKEKMLSDFGV